LKPLKILEAPDPVTQFEIPEDGDPRLHLYENLKHWLFFFMFAPCINNIKNTFFIIPTDAHYYKSVEMLKQFKYAVRTAQLTHFISNTFYYSN
jgi:hypothetical protein